MKYVIDGCFGDGNLGDEALLAAVCKMINANDDSAEITAISSDPEATQRLHGVNVTLQLNPIGATMYAFLVKGELLRLVHTLGRSNCFVVGGGELFRDDVGARAVAGMFYRLFLAKLLRKRIVVLGVGMQQLRTSFGRFVLRRALEAAEVIVFRDRESLTLAQQLASQLPRSHTTADVAFTLFDCPGEGVKLASAGDDRVVTITIALKTLPSMHPFLTSCSYDDMIECMEHALRGIEEVFSKIDVRHVAFGSRDNVLGSQLVRGTTSLTTRISLFNSDDIWRTASTVGESDLVIAMPYHASVFAFAQGVPSIGIAYDRKVAKLYEEMGMAHWCLSPEELTKERLSALTIEALENRHQIRAELIRKAQVRKSELAEVFRDVLQLCPTAEA